MRMAARENQVLNASVCACPAKGLGLLKRRSWLRENRCGPSVARWRRVGADVGRQVGGVCGADWRLGRAEWEVFATIKKNGLFGRLRWWFPGARHALVVPGVVGAAEGLEGGVCNLHWRLGLEGRGRDFREGENGPLAVVVKGWARWGVMGYSECLNCARGLASEGLADRVCDHHWRPGVAGPRDDQLVGKDRWFSAPTVGVTTLNAFARQNHLVLRRHCERF